MSLYHVTVLSALSIVLPTLAALFRVKELSRKYVPLLILLLAGTGNEILSITLMSLHVSNAVNGNIYVLVEYFIIIWQFNRLGSSLSGRFITVLVILGGAAWITDNCVLHQLSDNNSLFRMVASLCIVYISIDKANQLLFFNGAVLIKNPDLMISMAFFAYYAFKTFLEAFDVFPMKIGPEFYWSLYCILAIINLLSNILFTIAILCIRKKQEFILRS